MDSYVMAETFKYLYLLFSEKEDMIIDVDKYIFTTEAHLLPLSLSLHPINNTKVYSKDEILPLIHKFIQLPHYDSQFVWPLR